MASSKTWIQQNALTIYGESLWLLLSWGCIATILILKGSWWAALLAYMTAGAIMPIFNTFQPEPAPEAVEAGIGRALLWACLAGPFTVILVAHNRYYRGLLGLAA